MTERAPMRQSAFTLIELLVVVTIIVILIALLTPALDRAVYQAELAVCLGNLKGIGSGVTGYAMENRRAYPYRATQRANDGWHRMNVIYTVDARNTPGQADATSDDRPYLSDFVPMKMLVDPLAGGIDLEQVAPDANGYSNYELFWGVTHQSEGGARFPGIFRVGDRMEFEDYDLSPGVRRKYAVLATDENKKLDMTPGVHMSHPDADGVTTLEILFNEGGPAGSALPSTYGHMLSRYNNTSGQYRGTIDQQSAFLDGSAQKLTGVTWDEALTGQRVGRVPIETTAWWVSWWTNVPSY